MFGNDNGQQNTGPVTSPTNASHSINDDIPAAPQEPQNQVTDNVGDPNSVFPASGSDDPFGTTPIIDDPAATADPQDMQASHQDNMQAPTTAPANHQAQTGNQDLIQIKQRALEELSPLVKHLDQSAEEKFKTTMMMIQASDDQSLVEEAFDAAKQITDDKVRAQALLDIINEINYFTQNVEN
jgi:hypothetical protein